MATLGPALGMRKHLVSVATIVTVVKTCLKYELSKGGDVGALPGQTISMSCRVGAGGEVEHESTLTSRSCILLEMD